MCSIAGIISPNSISAEADRSTVLLMNRILRHRGPDGTGIWQNDTGTVTFGHNRLAIIDLSSDASQPFTTADKRLTLIYNGEIYNYRELRQLCETQGTVFRTSSDTEVVIECFRIYGTKCFSMFRGMWALAIYDSSTESVTVSRDHFGIKPLYFGWESGKFVFASEIKALRLSFSSFAIEDKATVELFERWGYLDRGDWTFFENIKRLPPSHYATIDIQNSQINQHRYWAPPIEFNTEDSQGKVPQYLLKLLKESVEMHLLSDVEVGACLSGGVDSSAIVSLASATTARPLRTFTTRFPEHPEIDESSWATAIADATNSNATFIEPSYGDFERSFDKVLYFQDEPFGSTSIFSQYLIFEAIKKNGIKVVLDGQGADEVFAGYVGLIPVYVELAARNRRGLELLYNLTPLCWRYRQGTKLLRSAFNAWGKRSSNSISELTHLSKTIASRLEWLQRNHGTFEELLIDMVVDSNLPQLLRYEDRDSMAHSIEARVPFLNLELVNFGLKVPARLKFQHGYTKSILRAALKGVIPEQNRTRTDKLGFPAPEIAWLMKLTNLPSEALTPAAWRKIVLERWRKMLEMDWKTLEQ